MRSARHIILATLTAISVGAASPRPGDESTYELPDTGTNLTRRTGGWINFSLAGPRAVIRFYEQAKKPSTPDVLRGLAIFRYAAKSGFERTTFHLEDGVLKSPGNIHPPYRFRVILTLISDDQTSADGTEVFAFSFP